MNQTTIFTWGYYGWGNHTPQLVEAVDAVERSRGFEPPIFVDIRIRRTVRAKGFQGNAFEKLLGPGPPSLDEVARQQVHPDPHRPEHPDRRLFCGGRTSRPGRWKLRATSSVSSSFAVASGPAATARSPAIERRSPGWFWLRQRSVPCPSRSWNGRAGSRGGSTWT